MISKRVEITAKEGMPVVFGERERRKSDTRIADYRWMIEEACKGRILPDNFKLSFNYDDRSNISWGNVPSFHFHSWRAIGIESFTDFTHIMADNGLRKPVIDKAFWSGDLNNWHHRRSLYNQGQARSDILDVRDVNANVFYPNGAPSGLTENPNAVSMDKMWQWRILLDCGARGWHGRRPYMFYARRPMILTDDAGQNEFWKHGLKPGFHYLQMKPDCSDVVSLTEMLLNNEDMQQQLAYNAYNYESKKLPRLKLSIK